MFDFLDPIFTAVKWIAALGTVGLALLVLFGITSLSSVLNAISSIIQNLMPAINLLLVNTIEGIKWYVTEFWGDAQMVMHNLSIVLTILIPLYLGGMLHGYNWADEKRVEEIADIHDRYLVTPRKEPRKAVAPKRKKPNIIKRAKASASRIVPTIKKPKPIHRNPTMQSVLGGSEYAPR